MIGAGLFSGSDVHHSLLPVLCRFVQYRSVLYWTGMVCLYGVAFGCCAPSPLRRHRGDLLGRDWRGLVGSEGVRYLYCPCCFSVLHILYSTVLYSTALCCTALHTTVGRMRCFCSPVSLAGHLGESWEARGRAGRAGRAGRGGEALFACGPGVAENVE